MKKQGLFQAALLGASLLWLCSTNLAQANATTINDDNSSFVLSHGDPTILGSLATSGEWFVDGRRILTYVSAPANLIDVGFHHHSDSHVSANQLHAAGQILGGLPRGLDIAGGIVYTVDGSTAGSGMSRLVETVELTLGSSITSPIDLHLTGFGFEPFPHGTVTFEKPDLTGLHVTGTTLVFAQTGSFSAGPFGSLTVLPFHAFTGFNTFNQDITLNPNTTLRMITELNVGPIPEPSTWLSLIAGLVVVWRFAGRNLVRE